MAEIITDIAICNAALSRLGQDPISAIGESSKEGELCAVFYESTRNALLRSHPWNFATKRAVLVQDATASSSIPFEYTYAYRLPNDCLRIIRTKQEADNLPHDYRVEGRFLLTDETEVAIEYVYKTTTVGDYDALFLQLFILDLAIVMCMPLADNASLKQSLIDERNTLAPSVQTIDAQEGATREAYDANNWLYARL